METLGSSFPKAALQPHPTESVLKAQRLCPYLAIVLTLCLELPRQLEEAVGDRGEGCIPHHPLQPFICDTDWPR